LIKLPADLARQKAELDERGGSEAFPYDPRARSAGSAKGLDLLRTIEDRELARKAYQLHWTLAAKDLDPRERARMARRELEELLERAVAGKFGPEAKELAQHLGLADRSPYFAHTGDLLRFKRALGKLGTT
jgi:hypothetical protein